MATISVAVNEIGRRVGESHHNAKLTNGEVALLFALHEEGWGYRKLAAKFEVSKSLVRYIIKGRWRCQTPANYRVVHVID